MENKLIITSKKIENQIYTVRGQQVMLDSDLASIYQVETKVFNQAVKRPHLRPKEGTGQAPAARHLRLSVAPPLAP
jgi:hypothetical protein